VTDYARMNQLLFEGQHQEIRRLLLRLGEAPMFKWLFHGEASIVPEIVSAVFTLAQRRIGALIVIEREVGLSAIIEGGTPVNAAQATSTKLLGLVANCCVSIVLAAALGWASPLLPP
jgi:DNA integrity scanning protein DisA with diadenylate cyclase activity